MRPEITDAMIDAGLLAWFGASFVNADRALQVASYRDSMRRVIGAALEAAPTRVGNTELGEVVPELGEVTRSPGHRVTRLPKLVIVESPYAGDVEGNVRYARACVRDSLLRGEAPIASHLLHTQAGILNDDVPTERAMGIDAGHAWYRVADLAAVYMDRGMSGGMRAGIQYASAMRVPTETRLLGSERAQ